MSELSTNSVSNELEASQTGMSGERTSQSAASAQVNLDTQPTPQPIPNPLRRTGKREFPPYTRSLLRVRVPVVVTLAQKKQTLGRILEIGPGQILQFDKSCEKMLDLEVSNCKIASGEAVKVGDKFGLSIISIVPPEERFIPVRPTNKV
ncbi:MAG: FliM/FliN family flagellar motor C-terminal domain-containing protein [Thermoguttaceae bacterium]